MRLESICVRYGEKRVLDGFTADFGPGITCIVGPSGFGKTTLLHTIAGLVKPESGQIVDGPARAALMFQDDRLFPWMSALQNVAVVCGDEARARQALDAVELADEADSRPETLSGGMRRRVALARALAYGGDMLLLDEPFKGMDLPLIERLVPLIRACSVPVLCATHGPEEQALLGGDVLALDRL